MIQLPIIICIQIILDMVLQSLSYLPKKNIYIYLIYRSIHLILEIVPRPLLPTVLQHTFHIRDGPLSYLPKHTPRITIRDGSFCYFPKHTLHIRDGSSFSYIEKHIYLKSEMVLSFSLINQSNNSTAFKSTY